jgi:hypothetical protein
MRASLIIIFILLTGTLKGQEPFEKYPAVSYSEFKDWKVYDKLAKEKKVHYTLAIPGFFENKDSITIQLTSFADNWDSSYVRIYRNKKLVQKLFEPMGFSLVNVFEPIRIADINGDGLADLKILIPYMGNGIAALNVRVIYLFQKCDGNFTKISFDDKMNENRPERDYDGDKNYEIITMTLTGYENHSYWLYNLYDYSSNGLINVNGKNDYPIMIQFLYRENFKITDKITRLKMKDFALPLPDEYDKR